MAHAKSPQKSHKSSRKFLICLRASLKSIKPALLLGGSLTIAGVAIAQQPPTLQQPKPVTARPVTVAPGATVSNNTIPPTGPNAGGPIALPNASMPNTGMPNAVAANPAGQVRLQIYDIPSDLVGSVGANLQIQFGQYSDVRVTTEPKTGKLMVMAPELIQRQIAAQVQTVMANVKVSPQTSDKGMNVGSYQQQTFHLKNLSWRELEDSLSRLGGPKLTLTTERNGELAVFRIPNLTGMQDILQVDRRMNQVSVLGAGATSAGWMQVMQSLDNGQVDRQRTTQVVPLSPAEPRRVKRAFQLVKATLPQDEKVQATVPQGNPNDPATAFMSKDGTTKESGLFGDVQIEFIEEIDLVIIRGSKRDVDRTLEVIQKIKEQAKDTQPKIEVLNLQHANSQAVETLVTKLYEAIYATRQGPISITALGQPNALLLIGRDEVVESVKELVAKLDVPLDPSNQLKVVRLLHASAVDAEATVRGFFVEKPGGGEDNRAALGTRVKVLADFRTNSLILQGSARELEEVEKLIAEIDVEGTTATNSVRVFPLKNAIAADLQTVIQNVIDGEAASGGGAAGGAGGGGGGQATPPSGKLQIVPMGGSGSPIESGILAGVVVTADPAVNALVVRAPSKSMELIAELILQLDRLPGAEAKIKVFQVKNSNAVSLATLVQQLFGLPATAGQGTTGFLGIGQQQQQQLGQQALTTGEGSLVQLRVTPDTRTNSLIVSGGASDLEVIEVLLLRLDEEGVQTRRTEVVWLRNTNAADVATALTNFLNLQRQATTQTLIQGGLITAYEQVDREVFIVAEQLTNSVVLSATPRYFETMMKVIERLDRRPPLVAIQVLVAQVTLTDQFELGTELGLQDALLFNRGTASSGTLKSDNFIINAPQQGGSLANLNALGGVDQRQQVAGQGMSAFQMGRASSTLGYGGLVLSAASQSVNVLLRALQDAGRLQVLSRPQIMTMDNRIASLLVGQLVPRIQGTTTGINGQSVNAIDTPVGLQLQIVPRVNQDGLILMPLTVTNSNLGPIDAGVPVGFAANGDTIRSPIINTTTATTTISAYSGQTVVFAGLISKTRGSTSRKVPFLGDIPILGLAFRFESETEQRNELLVVLTPRLISTDEDLETFKQVESSRMSWCLSDILNIHGDVGLNGGNGLWGPAKGPVIYPDMQPATIIDNGQRIPVETMPTESIYEAGTGASPGMTPGLSPDVGAANGRGNPAQNSSPYQTISYTGAQPVNSQPASSMPMLNRQPVGPTAPQNATVPPAGYR